MLKHKFNGYGSKKLIFLLLILDLNDNAKFVYDAQFHVRSATKPDISSVFKASMQVTVITEQMMHSAGLLTGSLPSHLIDCSLWRLMHAVE